MIPSRRIAWLSWLVLGALSASCNLNPHGEDPSFDNANGAGIFQPTDPAMGAPTSAASMTSSPEMMGPTIEEPGGTTSEPPDMLPVTDPMTGIPTGTPTGTTTASPTSPPTPTEMPTATATAPIDTAEPVPPLTDDSETDVGSGGAGAGTTDVDGGGDTDSPDGGANVASILTTDGGTDLGAEQAETTLDADGGAAGRSAF